jgi:hypothetical protein
MGGGRQGVRTRIDRQCAIALRSPDERTGPNLARIEFIGISNTAKGKPIELCRSNRMLAKKILPRPKLPVLVPLCNGRAINTYPPEWPPVSN